MTDRQSPLLEMPEELQDRYGYPEITPETKERIFGINFAAGVGMDLDGKRRGLGLGCDG